MDQAAEGEGSAAIIFDGRVGDRKQAMDSFTLNHQPSWILPG